MRPKLQIRAGALCGVEEADSLSFLGIPYASSTAGARRFRAPVPPIPWSGSRDAFRPGPAAPQPTRLPAALRRWSAVPPCGVSEDCLSLNVWMPRQPGTGRPVMLWVHGGGFTRGSNSWYLYSGARLASRGDVVVVGVNYRLGVLGALATGEMGGSASSDSNVGLRDQIAALEWVVENIADFGGDPENITVFGQSAGAMSLASLISFPAARKRIRRAILQSGAAQNVLQPQQARAVARRFCAILGIDSEGPHALAELRGRAVQELLSAQVRVSAEHRLPLGMMAWQPVIDDDLLPRLPIESWPGEQNPPPEMLIGANLDEWKMFTVLDAKRRNLDQATLRRHLEQTLTSAPHGTSAVESALNLYGQAANGSVRQPGQIWAALQGDRVFHFPAVSLADRNVGGGADTWFYRFDWTPTRAPERLGACHSMELPFVFGSVRHPIPRWLLGARADARALSDRVQDAWLAFARTGDPRTEIDSDWPAYRSVSGRSRVFGGTDGSAVALSPAVREFWTHQACP